MGLSISGKPICLRIYYLYLKTITGILMMPRVHCGFESILYWTKTMKSSAGDAATGGCRQLLTAQTLLHLNIKAACCTVLQLLLALCSSMARNIHECQPAGHFARWKRACLDLMYVKQGSWQLLLCLHYWQNYFLNVMHWGSLNCFPGWISSSTICDWSQFFSQHFSQPPSLPSARQEHSTFVMASARA